MFDRLKQMKQLRDIQKSIEAERVEVEERGVRVVIKGTLAVEEIRLNPELPAEEQAAILKRLLNEAQRKMQGVLSQKLAGMMPQ